MSLINVEFPNLVGRIDHFLRGINQMNHAVAMLISRITWTAIQLSIFNQIAHEYSSVLAILTSLLLVEKTIYIIAEEAR